MTVHYYIASEKPESNTSVCMTVSAENYDEAWERIEEVFGKELSKRIWLAG